MSWFLWHSSKWAHRLGHFLQYMSGIVALACSLDTKPELCDYYAPIAPFLETQCFGYSQSQILCNSSSTLTRTQGPLLNFLTKCIHFEDPWLSILCFWPCYIVIICLTLILPALLLVLTRVCVLIVLNSNCFGRIKIYFKPIYTLFRALKLS